MNDATPQPDHHDRTTTTHRVRTRLRAMDHHRLHQARLRFRQLLTDGVDSTDAAWQAVRETQTAGAKR